MSMIISITGYRTLSAKVVLFAAVFSLVGLISYIAKYVKKRKLSMLFITILTLLSFITSAIIFADMFINYEILGIRSWMYTEYLEMYIAIGLFIYTLDFIFKWPKAKKAALKTKNSK